MKTVRFPRRRNLAPADGVALPPLEIGERLTQPEFHRRYLQYPDHVKFELVGGVVYMASPVRVKHGSYDGELGFLLGMYRRSTPGVECLHNVTTILGEESEPQPDLGLFILAEYGGRSRINADGYMERPPEMPAEIAYSSRTIDLSVKKIDYEKAGVLEYIVVCIEEQEFHWFHLASRRRITPDRAGISRSKVFPGLWIDGPALLARDSVQLEKVIRQGLASPEHKAFVRRLERARKKHSEQ